MTVYNLQIITPDQLVIHFACECDEADERNNIHECLRNGICYESELAWVMLRMLKPGDIAIDVGANIGFFTMLMAKLVGPTGHVIALEPGELAREYLMKNIEHNKLSNVTVLANPAWRNDEKVTFYQNADTATSSALVDPGSWWENEKSRMHPNPIEMEGRMIDTLMLDLDRGKLVRPIKLIKIDTEGGEMPVLMGARNTLKISQPAVLVEVNPFGMKQFGYDERNMRDFMKPYGYDLFFIRSDSGLPALIPDQTKIKFVDQFRVINALFSTIDQVGAAWPDATGIPGHI